MTQQQNSFPSIGYLRLSQIVPGIIPVSKSTWWAGVKNGRYPKPVKLSPRCTAWKAEDIRALCDRPAALNPTPA